MKKYGKRLNWALPLGIVLLACGSGPSTQAQPGEASVASTAMMSQQVPEAVSATELHEVLAVEDDNRVVLDVRTPGEVEQGVIVGAVVMDYRSADFEERLKELDVSKHYYVVCASGGRSGRTQSMMAGLGFEQVTNVVGGMNDWKAQGYPVLEKQ
ncbi:MAG TPA: hypothetical protein DCE41_28640 [Cytophagales bacterium]|nr:hypothetical protein [Cytophagales bacterium]HAA17590.1 hypothetical protein [Cytophagales bacterium]HAP61666.1 hypothetical protein [Cytophagales bacterium]